MSEEVLASTESDFAITEVSTDIDVEELVTMRLRRESIPSNIGVRTSHRYRR